MRRQGLDGVGVDGVGRSGGRVGRLCFVHRLHECVQDRRAFLAQACQGVLVFPCADVVGELV